MTFIKKYLVPNPAFGLLGISIISKKRMLKNLPYEKDGLFRETKNVALQNKKKFHILDIFFQYLIAVHSAEGFSNIFMLTNLYFFPRIYCFNTLLSLILVKKSFFRSII